ncbi:MAG TPA: AI-2E family transporter [Prolixibacteraceae bacterium]|nr:AI-2E family transporter [Prolixibacteraceae bacterium]
MDQRVKNIIIAVAILLFGLMVYFLSNIVAYILIAAVMSLIGSPLTRKFQSIHYKKFRIGKSLAAFLTILTLWICLIGFFIFLIPLVASEVNQLSTINIHDVVEYLNNSFQTIQTNYPGLVADITHNATIESYLKTQLSVFVNFGQVSSVFGSIATAIGNLFLMFFSVSFVLFFFLKEEGLFGRWILILSPARYEERVSRVIGSVRFLLKRYMIGILLQILGVMIISTLGFTIVGLGFSHAVVVGVFAGLINVIPYIGPWIGALFGLVVAVANNLQANFMDVTLPLMIMILVVVLVVQFIDNMIFQTIIYSKSVESHPLEIFLVTMIAGSLAGIPGMILGIPAYTVLRVIASEFLSEFEVIQSLTKGK